MAICIIIFEWRKYIHRLRRTINVFQGVDGGKWIKPSTAEARSMAIWQPVHSLAHEEHEHSKGGKPKHKAKKCLTAYYYPSNMCPSLFTMLWNTFLVFKEGLASFLFIIAGFFRSCSCKFMICDISNFVKSSKLVKLNYFTTVGNP